VVMACIVGEGGEAVKNGEENQSLTFVYFPP